MRFPAYEDNREWFLTLMAVAALRASRCKGRNLYPVINRTLWLAAISLDQQMSTLSAFWWVEVGFMCFNDTEPGFYCENPPGLHNSPLKFTEKQLKKLEGVPIDLYGRWGTFSR